MQTSLKYAYESSILRVASLHLSQQINIDIVVTSDRINTICVGFNRSDSNRVRLGYKQIARVVRGTIQSIEDVLRTDNEMIASLRSENVIIHISVSSNSEDRRLRMYKRLIGKHGMRMDQDKDIPFSHVKTDIINNDIKIFIQRT